MSKKRPSHIDSIRDDADLRFEIDLIFQDRSAEILVIDRDDEIEIVVADIPCPSGYYLDLNGHLDSAKQDSVEKHSIAQWVLEDSAQVLDRYNWKEANSRARSGNYYLDGIYFKIERQNIDKAVIDAKKFLTTLEQSLLRHSQEFSPNVDTPPSEALENK